MDNCSFNDTALTMFTKDALIFPHHDIRSTQYYMCGICLTFIAYMGIVLNCVSIAVFARDRPTKTTSVFLLQALAIADSIYLIMIFFRYPLPILLVYNNKDCTFGPYTRFLAQNLQYLRIPLRSTGIVAIWMVGVVTLDRYIAIYYTLKATKLCRIKTVLLEICAVVSYATIYSISKYVVLDIYNKKRIIWIFWTWDAFNTLTPVLVVFILNFRIWRSLIIANRWRKETRVFSIKHKSTSRNSSDENINLTTRLTEDRSINGNQFMKVRSHTKKLSDTSSHHSHHSHHSHKEKKFHDTSHSDITARLIAVATTYLICESPMLILSVYIILNSWFSIEMDKRTAHILFLIAHALQCINSSINFFLYFFSGRKFRKNLEELMQCCRQRRKHSRTSLIRLSYANNVYRTCNSEMSGIY